MSATWQDLAELRHRAKRPALPVVVTTDERISYNLGGVGAMVIVHERGTEMPVALLAGLDVILMLDTCVLAARVHRLMGAKGVVVASMRAWCRCEKELSTCVGPCELKAQSCDESFTRAAA